MEMKSSSKPKLTLDMHAGWNRPKQEEAAVVCWGIIITGKYPRMQDSIELKKFEVAKLFVVCTNPGFWVHHGKSLP
jgi:hypothetical protein